MTTPDPILTDPTDSRHPEAPPARVSSVAPASSSSGGDPPSGDCTPPYRGHLRRCRTPDHDVYFGRLVLPSDDGTLADFDDPDDPLHDVGIWMVVKNGCVVEVVGSVSEANLLADMLLASSVERTDRLEFVEVVCGPLRGDC